MSGKFLGVASIAKAFVILVFLASPLSAQNSPHGPLKIPCTTCHVTDSWTRNAGATFDHSKTGFSLEGQHQATSCKSCHSDLKFDKQSKQCQSCHEDVHRKDLGDTCQRCHNSDTWKVSNMVSRHSTTRFPLVGRHETAECSSCHQNSQQHRYSGASTDCIGCHRADYMGSKNPNHISAGFSASCEKCHMVSDLTWSKAMVSSSGFDHASTGFPLTGAHVHVDCATCHKNNQYTGLSPECYSCHATDYSGTVTPNHVSGNFDHNCTICHTTLGWIPASASNFDHAATPFGFAWTGKHVTATCEDCHTNGNFSLHYTTCYVCHSTDFSGAANPNHVTGNFDHDCTKCHSIAAWQPASFDHSTTGFPLTGKHATTACQDCHTGGNYALKYIDCYACHSADFQQTTNPNHVSGNFSHDCSTCHSTAAWQPASFDHSTTAFPLTGKHTTVLCQDCHTNSNYTLNYTDCYPCHSSDFAMPTNPNHVTGNFNHDCTGCHSTSAWKPSTFNHSTTAFPLTGAHMTTPCQSCHTNGNYTTLAYIDCYTCHATNFNGTTNPNHVSGNLDHDCTKCHSTSVWQPSTFNHSATGFALTGAHTTTPCQSCHTNGNYTTLAYIDCYTCHSTDFNGTTNPNHVSGNLDHDCTKCHSTSVWQPSTFNHSTTGFPLTGAHTTTPCQSCHLNGNYTTLAYTDCYACHSGDFGGTVDPNHVSGNFSHDCTTCHSTSVWKPSTFNHSTTAFPLTGAHVTVPCQSCHTNGNYTTVRYTDCYACHSADFTGATNPNHVQGNFGHDCTQCHSSTSWSGATFDHSTTGFPLTGTHTTTPCQSCHTNGNYALTYTDCYPCHTADFAQPTDPNHVTSRFSHDCTPCHTTTAWLPSTFNHAQYFSFNKATEHRSATCVQCHQVTGNYTLFNCQYACHRNAHNSGNPCWPCHKS